MSLTKEQMNKTFINLYYSVAGQFTYQIIMLNLKLGSCILKYILVR